MWGRISSLFAIVVVTVLVALPASAGGTQIETVTYIDEDGNEQTAVLAVVDDTDRIRIYEEPEGGQDSEDAPAPTTGGEFTPVDAMEQKIRQITRTHREVEKLGESLVERVRDELAKRQKGHSAGVYPI